MTKGQITFDLHDPDDREDWRTYNQAHALSAAMWDVEMLLRRHARKSDYPEQVEEVLETIYGEFFEIKSEYNITDE
jgi:hypothetical protein